jgi:hypothetical protein
LQLAKSRSVQTALPIGQLRQQVIEAIERGSQCRIVLLLHVLLADVIRSQQAPRFIAQGRKHLFATGIGVLQLDK